MTSGEEGKGMVAFQRRNEEVVDCCSDNTTIRKARQERILKGYVAMRLVLV